MLPLKGKMGRSLLAHSSRAKNKKKKIFIMLQARVVVFSTVIRKEREKKKQIISGVQCATYIFTAVLYPPQ